MVIALTGRPVTKRSDICLRTGAAWEPCCHSTPELASALGSGSPFCQDCSTGRTGCSSSCQAFRRGKAKRLHQTSSAKPIAQVGCWLVASNQSVASVFFRRYCGSGLVIQCLARFQLVLRRLRAQRTLSSEMGAPMMPCSKLTWATSSNVQVLRCLPKSLGGRCRSSFNC
jgi:hypothetical protein